MTGPTGEPRSAPRDPREARQYFERCLSILEDSTHRYTVTDALDLVLATAALAGAEPPLTDAEQGCYKRRVEAAQREAADRRERRAAAIRASRGVT